MMNDKILRGCLVVTFGLATLFISSCVSDFHTGILPVQPVLTVDNGSSAAQQFNGELAEAIERADKIVFKEHSDKVDFFGTTVAIHGVPTYTYARRELSEGEKMQFLEDVKALEGKDNQTQTRCVFEAHHTIDFYEYGQLKSSLRICYQCNEVQWNGTSVKSSKDVFEAITPMILRAGMKTKRDWDAMAKQRFEEESKPKLPAPVAEPPLAKWAPGQKGRKVLNPFTGEIVDVEGIPANTKVRDPNDKDSAHVFRVPES